MALPRDLGLVQGDEDGAPRIDLVALERFGEEIRVVFWEAKTFDDKRLRTYDEGKLKVVKQLNLYRDYLVDLERQQAIVEAYRETCRLFVALWEMRDERIHLHPLIVAAAEENSRLVLDVLPRLLIFGDRNGKSAKQDSSWTPFKKEIEDAGIEMIATVGAESIYLPVWRFSRAQLEALAEFKASFDEPGFVFASWFQPESKKRDVTFFGHMILSTEAERFFNMCYRQGWVLMGFDWTNWSESAEAQRLRSHEAIRSATAEQLAKLLTMFIRVDRFCDGALSGAFDEGFLTSIVRRADRLANELR